MYYKIKDSVHKSSKDPYIIRYIRLISLTFSTKFKIPLHPELFYIDFNVGTLRRGSKIPTLISTFTTPDVGLESIFEHMM
jgi:hypothetical protein